MNSRLSGLPRSMTPSFPAFSSSSSEDGGLPSFTLMLNRLEALNKGCGYPQANFLLEAKKWLTRETNADKLADLGKVTCIPTLFFREETRYQNTSGSL